MFLSAFKNNEMLSQMNYMGFATWLSIGVAVACLLYLRWKLPNAPRPIKVYFML